MVVILSIIWRGLIAKCIDPRHGFNPCHRGEFVTNIQAAFGRRSEAVGRIEMIMYYDDEETHTSSNRHHTEEFDRILFRTPL